MATLLFLASILPYPVLAELCSASRSCVALSGFVRPIPFWPKTGSNSAAPGTRPFVGRRAADSLDRNRERPLEDAHCRERLVVANRLRQPHFFDDGGPDGTHALLARAVPRRGERQDRLGRDGLRQPRSQRRTTDSSKNSHASPTPLTDGEHVFVHFRRTRDGLPDDRRNDRVEDARDQVSAATWQRRIARPGRRAARLQLRRLRRAVRRRARRGNRQDPLEERAASLR